MSLNLLDAANGLIPDNLVTKAAQSLGETETNIRKGLKGAIPSVIAGLLHQSSRGDGPGVMEVLHSVSNSGVQNKLADLFDGKKNLPGNTVGEGTDFSKLIPGWLRSVFGGKLINIINAISIYSDLRSSSANAILGLAASAALSSIASHMEENQLGAAGVDALLQSQKTSVINAIPAGFNLTGSLGINSLHDIGTRIVNVEPKPNDYQRNTVTKTNIKWIWPLLLVFTFGGLIWFFSNRSTEVEEAPVAVADTTTRLVIEVPVDSFALPQAAGKLDSISGNFIYDAGMETELLLPDSSLLKVGKYSTESRLFRMLTDQAWVIDSVDKTKNWITFDRIYFETNKSILTPASKLQIANIANLLKNFPKASIKIGGYTDNAGDSILNKKISSQRALIVMRELIKSGAGSKQVTEAEGYGSQYPICPSNDNDGCKARNRRVDLKLASK